MNVARHPIKRSIAFFLIPDFTMVAFATALEPLRIANRMLGYEAYRWRLASLDGQPVPASNGVLCAVNTSLEDERRKMAGPDRPSMVIVCSGINIERYANKSAFAWLREEYNRGVAIGGLCTGAHVLAAAGLLAGKRCAIHWENLPGFAEAFPKANVFADLFEVDQNIYTCAGGTAALDMMLQLIGDDFDDSLVNRVCEPGELVADALAIARRIADNAPISIRQAKRSIHHGLSLSLHDGMLLEIEAYNRMVPTEDRREGILAFNEKRKPVFRGR